MCDFCEDMMPKTPGVCDTPGMDVEARIEALFSIDTKKRTYCLVVSNVHTCDEAYFGIHYCPMCGRRLTDKGKR